MVPQFETCSREIQPEFIQNFLPRHDVYNTCIFPSSVFRCLAFLELSTGSVHCAPDENDRPSEQTELCFAFVNLCCFLILFLLSSLKYVRKTFNIYLTLKKLERKLHRFSLVLKRGAFKFALEYQKIYPYKLL